MHKPLDTILLPPADAAGRIAILTDARGTLLDHVLHLPAIRPYVHALVTDRDCQALDVARRHNLHTARFPLSDNRAFSDALAQFLAEQSIDYTLVFFSRLLTGRLLDAFRNRLFNLHNSLLPAFPGFGAVTNAFDYGVRFLGATFHVIDDSIDAGPVVCQTVVPVTEDHLATRHRLFVHNTRMTAQLILWLAQRRVHVDRRRVTIDHAAFDESLFAPALEHPDVRSLDFPLPAPERIAHARA